MIDIEKHYPDRLYFKIDEVASFIDVPSSTLTYWGKEFSAIQPRVNGKGDKLYSKEDIKLVRFVHHLLKDKKYTIEGAKQVLAKRKDFNKFHAIERLEKVKFLLEELRKQL